MDFKYPRRSQGFESKGLNPLKILGLDRLLFRNIVMTLVLYAIFQSHNQFQFVAVYR